MSPEGGPPVSTKRVIPLRAGIGGPLGSGNPQRAIVFSGAFLPRPGFAGAS